MKTVTEHDPISLDTLRDLAPARFGDLVEGGVDDPAIRGRIIDLVVALVRR